MSTAENLKNLSLKPEGYYSVGRSEMLAFIPAGSKKIIDAGCGEGMFAAAAKEKFGAEVWGLELDKESASRAGAKLHKVLQGDLADTISQLPDGYFDCFVFNDVLEHLSNPYEVLSQVRAKLAKGGVVVCSIPNVRYWRVWKSYVFGKDWKYEDNGVMDKTHLRFFTRRSIAGMFAGLNYEVLQMKGLNPTPSVLFHILNVLSFFSLRDCRFIQYACVVRPGGDL